MNSYDAKHLQLMDLIEAGKWQNISERDADELRVLVVCGYVSIKDERSGKPRLALNQEGRHYHRQLSHLTTLAQSA